MGIVKLKNFCISFLIFLYVSPVFSQNYTIEGFVVDSTTGEHISHAQIRLSKSNNIVFTNEYGFFSLTVSNTDSVILIVDALNYDEESISINLPSNSLIYIKMHPLSVNLSLVTVEAEARSTSVNNLNISVLHRIPSIGGESDVMKAFMLMPGVEAAENKSSLFVRGGADDQNLVIIDNVPLYHVSHLGGFVSIFNTDALQNARMLKGAFPAYYGNRLSSVIDITMKEGNNKRFRKVLSLGLISSKFLIEGPIKKDTSSFLFSVRRFYLDIFTRPITYFTLDKIQMGYNFYDINFKVNTKLNDNNHLYFSFYKGRDKVFFKYTDINNDLAVKEKLSSVNDFDWGNTLFAFRFNHSFSKKMFSNTTLSYTKYNSNNLSRFFDEVNSVKVQDNQVSFHSGINDIRLNLDLQYFCNNNIKLRVGGNVIRHLFRPAQNRFVAKDSANRIILDTTFNNIQQLGYEFNFYLDNQLSYKNLYVDIGFRFTYFDLDSYRYPYIEPRVSLRYKVPELGYFTAAYTIMHQNIHKLTYLSAGMPLTLWIPSDRYISPSKATQLSLGFEKKINFLYLTTEVYYKKMTSLVDVKNPAALFTPSLDFTDNVALNGIGKAYGLEILLEKKTGKLSGWVSYTLSRSTRQFDDINRGREYLFAYDRTNSLNIVGVYHFSDRISISADWVYATGLPYTVIDEKYRSAYGSIDILNYYEINNGRLPDFHKLDIALKFTKELKKNRIRTFSIDIYNVYNRKNTSYYIIKRDLNSDRDRLYKVTLFPLIPTFSYRLEF